MKLYRAGLLVYVHFRGTVFSSPYSLFGCGIIIRRSVHWWRNILKSVARHQVHFCGCALGRECLSRLSAPCTYENPRGNAPAPLPRSNETERLYWNPRLPEFFPQHPKTLPIAETLYASTNSQPTQFLHRMHSLECDKFYSKLGSARNKSWRKSIFFSARLWIPVNKQRAEELSPREL